MGQPNFHSWFSRRTLSAATQNYVNTASFQQLPVVAGAGAGVAVVAGAGAGVAAVAGAGAGVRVGAVTGAGVDGAGVGSTEPPSDFDGR